MGTKRKKWTEEEDETLKKILQEEDSINDDVNWEMVAKEMEERNFLKTPK